MKEQLRILTDSAVVVNRIVQLLDEESIPSLVRDNVESARLAGFGTSPNDVELFVHHSDASRAESIIMSLVKK